MAAFHAAQALIFERTNKIARTHKGVHTEFARLITSEATLDARPSGFLHRAYNLKAVADYETGPESDISPQRAVAAVEEAETFLDVVRGALKA